MRPSSQLPFGAHDHVFNDDLLMNDKDLAFAKSQFPQIFHVLNNPRLREKFAEYEYEANKAREWVRGLGFIAVISAALALLTIATKPVWPHAVWVRWAALVIELGGMFASLIAAGGLWLGPWKRRWLESRLMTERLRQWHFQLLVRRGQEIEASCKDPSAIAHFQEERERWLEDFLKQHEGKLDAQLESIIEEPAHAETWLHDPLSAYNNRSATLAHVLRAYERLRFDHQYNYTVWKLRKFTDQPP